MHPTPSWVIIDDHRDMGPLLERLIQTDPGCGLRHTDVEQALAMLAIFDPLDYN